MTQRLFLSKVVRGLESAGIACMVRGSVGSSFHGEPRATLDVDMVIDPSPGELDRFLDLLGPGFYVDRSAAHEALETRSMFNVIDTDTGWKADLIVRKERPFSVAEFARRDRVDLGDMTVVVASPEDVILSKLEWSVRAESERQYRDALGVARTQGAGLDRAYFETWAKDLGLADLLARLLRHATADDPDDPTRDAARSE